jgi:2-polyprenyl-3-methyl-5-hydroxy-6-metoxy-1,4-benzoquinol methylase
MVGIDISAGAISLANTQLIKYPTDNVTFQLQLEPNLKQQPNYDIILATLVCHHLNDEELIQFLKESYAHCNRAIILNDLHRHPIAYWFYKVFSPLLFRNKIISHDGAISILRSFTRKDWLAVLNKAGIKHYQVRWCFPFRWRILIWKK